MTHPIPEWVKKAAEELVRKMAFPSTDVDMRDWETELFAFKAGSALVLERARVLESGLDRVIALTHSWVITEQTGPVIAPMMDKIRIKAQEALEKFRETQSG